MAKCNNKLIKIIKDYGKEIKKIRKESKIFLLIQILLFLKVYYDNYIFGLAVIGVIILLHLFFIFSELKESKTDGGNKK